MVAGSLFPIRERTWVNQSQATAAGEAIILALLQEANLQHVKCAFVLSWDYFLSSFSRKVWLIMLLIDIIPLAADKELQSCPLPASNLGFCFNLLKKRMEKFLRSSQH